MRHRSSHQGLLDRLRVYAYIGTFLDEFSEFSGKSFRIVDIAIPSLDRRSDWEYNCLLLCRSCQVRRQCKENCDIITYKAKPDYQKCVGLVIEAASREMQFPALIWMATPIVVGLVFRFIGEGSDRVVIRAEVVASYLMFGTVTGILMALFLDTSGGAWDNAKDVKRIRELRWEELRSARMCSHW